jgi:pimeloyl-ACP methyl ester carboxylesterase
VIDQYVDTAMARFRYARTGTGPPVLLLPGSGGWRLTFHTMAAVLAQRHTVFALDPPGQGLTEVLDPGFGYDADAIARSIAGFLDAVGLERTAIVGHSWGGGFALRFAQLYPARVTRLALLAPGGLDVKDIWEFRLLRLLVVGGLAVRLTSMASVRHLLRKSFVHRERISDDLIGEVVGELRSGRNRAARRTDMLRVERSVTKEKAERWTRWRAFAQIRHSSNIQLLPYSLVAGWTPNRICISCARPCCCCGAARTAISRCGSSTGSSPACRRSSIMCCRTAAT